MYHETLWVAVAAASPIIALAAIVALADVGAMSSRSRQWQVEHPPWTFPDETQGIANGAGGTAASMLMFNARLSECNIILQAIMLGFSLSSLYRHVDELPGTVAIAAEVLGITGLALAAQVSITIRRLLDHIRYLSIKLPTEYERYKTIWWPELPFTLSSIRGRRTRRQNLKRHGPD